MHDLSELAKGYIAESVKAQQSIDLNSVSKAGELLLSARANQNTVYIAGNGGSAATASHAAVDLLKTSSVKHGIPTLAVALSDHVPVVTAIANDSDYQHSFNEQIEWFGKPGDVLLAISASGNSPNILAAVNSARSKSMSVVALCGFGGGQLAKMADIAIEVQSNEYGPVEDAHMMIIHLFTQLLQHTEPNG